MLDPEIKTEGKLGELALTIFGMVAQMELTFIRERQRAGIDAAMQAGKYKNGGRPIKLDHAKAIAMRQEGLGVTEISKALKCSRRAVYKITASIEPTSATPRQRTRTRPRIGGTPMKYAKD